MASHNTVLQPREPDVFPGSYAIRARPNSAAFRQAPVDMATFGGGPPMARKESSLGDAETITATYKPLDAVLLAPSESWRRAVADIFDLSIWLNPTLWRAGLVEFASSIAFTFITGCIGVTVGTYPGYVRGPAIFVGNATSVSLFIYAISTATGAHINPLISIATAFTGLCHPVRSIIYVLCQAAGSCIGGAFLRVGLGLEKAIEVHNGGCYLDANGPVSVGQAAALEFMGAFSLLFVAFGVGLDPRQKELYGASLGPLLVGLTVGLMTAGSSALNEGYTGLGLFPGRCLGLQVGMGQLASHDWVWWLPDIAAAVMHAIVYHISPPYTKIRQVNSNSNPETIGHA